MLTNKPTLLTMGLALVAGTSLPAGPLEEPGTSVEPELARLADSYEQGYFEWTAQQYRKLARRPDAAGAALPIALGLARCLDHTGHYEEALETLNAVGELGRDSPDWHEAAARALSRLGRYQQALARVQAGLNLRPEHMACRLRLGQLYELLGQKDRAVETYAWFEALLRRDLPETADELVLAGRGLYRYSVLSRHPHLKDRTVYVLHELFQYAYERLDRRNWRARLASGNLLLDKHNLPEAVEEFEAALRLNPYLAEAHVGRGRAALEVWDFERVERSLRSALRHNPRHSGALLLRAELRMTERKYRQAASVCRDALQINPNDLAALGTLAAAQTRLGLADQAAKTQARVHELNPGCALLEYTLGRWLASARQFHDAEKHLRRATKLAPEWVEPRTELGLMYMETGQERAAEEVLKSAWALDAFNRHTYNTLQLLETLASFETVESPHFLIKLQTETDAALAPYLVRYLESIHDEVCADYGVQLEGKTVLEVFPTHGQFGVRITGRPWIHTIGASTGRVIAMDAPRLSSGFGRPFNWANVLRHEFTHTVTLAATENRIPQWFTEGLAVWQEDMPRLWAWRQLLAAALREDRMFTLQTIDWGFVRPRRPTDRQLAYAQSEWMVEYIVDRYGYVAVGRLIEAFRRGLTQQRAFPTVLSLSPGRFSMDFVQWAREQARPWHLPVDPLPSPFWLKWARFMRPKEAYTHTRLAESYFLAGQAEQAHRSALRALELDPQHAPALELLCRLVLAGLEAERDQERRLAIERHAEDWVKRLLELDHQNHAGLKLAAASAMDRGGEDQAQQLYRRLKTCCPADPVSYRRLAALALERGQESQALGNLIDLWSYDADDAEVPIQIATLLARKGKDREALVWLERAVHIDPYRADLHERLGALYSRFNRWEDAVVEYVVLSGLEPDRADHPARQAICYSRLGRPDKARQAARRAVQLDPQSPARSFLGE